MIGQGPNPKEQQRLVYQIEVAGELDAAWAPWFGADTVSALEGRTVFLVSVVDQSELHGKLRQAHNLHLRLLNVTLLNPER